MLLAACMGEMSEPAASDRDQARLGGDSALPELFFAAERSSGVPAPLLATLGYTLTRLTMIVPRDGEDGHGAPAWGLMALGGGGFSDVARAAQVAGLDAEAVRSDAGANVAAAAALIAEAARRRGLRPRTLEEWAGLLDFYGGEDLPREVAMHLERGWRGRDDEGRTLTFTGTRDGGRPARSSGGIERVVQSLGYAGATWNPATPSNYTVGNRGAPGTIRYVVIHTTQGSYSGTISWFKNPSARVSAHYVVRSSDGAITQMVDDKNVAWHASCYNPASIGIEHEGFIADPGKWYTEAMYAASARLTAWLTSQYGVARDRKHVVGHVELSSCNTHTDPGPGWNWSKYMDLVGAEGVPKLGARAGASSYPKVMTSGEQATVWLEFVNEGNLGWGINETRLGTQDPPDRASPFFVMGNWLNPTRPTGADRGDYEPGKTGRFSFVIKAPVVSETKQFKEIFQLVQEGNPDAWFGPKVTMTITVNPSGGPQPGTEPGAGAPGASPSGYERSGLGTALPLAPGGAGALDPTGGAGNIGPGEPSDVPPTAVEGASGCTIASARAPAACPVALVTLAAVLGYGLRKRRRR